MIVLASDAIADPACQSSGLPAGLEQVDPRSQHDISRLLLS